MAPRATRAVLAAGLSLAHVWAAMRFGPVFWLGAAGSLGIAAGWRKSGAAALAGGGAVALALIGAERAAVTNGFGADVVDGAGEVLVGAAIGAAALFGVAAALGFAPETKAEGRLRIVANLLTLALWAATAWLATSALFVHLALAPLSSVQLLRVWAPATGAAAALLFIAARAGRVGWLGACALPIVLLARMDKPADSGSKPAMRKVAGGAITSTPTVSPWRGPAGHTVFAPGLDARPGETANAVAKRAARTEVVPGFAVPTLSTAPLRVRSTLVRDGADPLLLDRDWTPGPPLSADSLTAAIGEGAAFLARNLQPDGRFTYIVRGPSGTSGSGYNYPRHAGTAWFLARVAATRAAQADVAATAARAALLHLDAVTGSTTDGRAFVLDPTRKDGKAWIGTTALAVLATRSLNEPPALHEAWALQVIASVCSTNDSDTNNGRVRGEMSTADYTFIDGDTNSYGQGQVMLALSALAADVQSPLRDDAAEALRRASEFVSGKTGGYYGTAHPLWVGDEHWMCLAAHGIRAANRTGLSPPIDTAGPDGVCAAYVAATALEAPPPGAGMPPTAGPAGGAAEAVVARAWDTGDTSLASASRDYAALFLASQYQPADIALLPAGPTPANLIGGFRDSAFELDVQIDAVQHIGGALLGVLALETSEDGPGRMP